MLRTAAVVAGVMLAACRPALAQSCDRACPGGILNGYFTGLAAHDRSKVAVSARVRITEDTKSIASGWDK